MVGDVDVPDLRAAMNVCLLALIYLGKFLTSDSCGWTTKQGWKMHSHRLRKDGQPHFRVSIIASLDRRAHKRDLMQLQVTINQMNYSRWAMVPSSPAWRRCTRIDNVPPGIPLQGDDVLMCAVV
jgi:hypothetical protein